MSGTATLLRRLIAGGALVASLTAGIAQADCRQALALGLDVSGSVDSAEYALQMQGLANAVGYRLRRLAVGL